MKLQTVTIENFRCFESLKIGFEEDVNVIVGVNGAGKTAMLDAITISLCEATIPPVASLNLSKNGQWYDAHHYEHVFCSSDDVYVGTLAKDSFWGQRGIIRVSASALLGHPTLLKNPLVTSWTQCLQADKSGKFVVRITDDLLTVRQHKDGVWSSAKTDTKSPLPVAVYYLAQRRMAETPPLGEIFNVTIERPMAFHNALHAGTDYQLSCQWFYLRENAELRERMEKNDSQFQYPDLKSVRSALGCMIEGFEKIYFDNAMPPRLTVDIRKQHDDGTGVVERLALDQVSDGYRNLLALVIDFARRLAMANPFMPNPLEAPGILMIDEIELHLHPRWQQTIIPNLRKAFPNTQLIVTTHSPQVLTSVENRCIRLLKDYQVFTTDEYTLGMEAKLPLERILGTNSRPPHSPSGDVLDAIFDLIEKNKLDEAEKLIRENERFKSSEPSLFEAESLIACRRWEKEAGL